MTSELVLPIVGDGAIAGPMADGRLIPILIVDTSARPDVAETIRVHRYVDSGGDVQVQWARSLDDDDTLFLILDFIRPIQLKAVLRFSIEVDGLLVETVLRAAALYLRAGAVGDRVMSTLDVPDLLVEVADSEFRPAWDQMLLDRMTLVMSGRLGIPRKKARPIAQDAIAEMQKLAGFRMRLD
jgi:hypothetical protein